MGKKITQLPAFTDTIQGSELAFIGDPITGRLKRITYNLLNNFFNKNSILFKSVNSYQEMIALGQPANNTIFEVLVDENKNYSRSTYLWKTSGRREWIASTPDN